MTTQARILGLTWVQLACLLLAAGYLTVEIVALATGARLISPTMRDDARRWLIWPFLFGVLAGHFYGPSFPRVAWWTPLVIAGVGAAIFVRDLLMRGRVPLPVEPAILAWGLLLGATLWAQQGGAP